MLDAWMHDEWMHGYKDTWMYGCVDAKMRKSVCFQAFFSCIAERARDIVGQLLEIRNEKKP